MSEQYPGGYLTKSNVVPTSTAAPGIWNISQQAQYKAAGLWPVAGGLPDAQFNYVTMLLRGDGSNAAQNNTFLDSGPNTYTITRNGNTTQGSFSPYGPGWSNYFDGTGDYIQTPSTVNAAFGTGDYTLEAWVNPTTAVSTYRGFLSSYTNATSGIIIELINGVWAFYNGASHTTSGVTAIFGAWTHIALTRSSGTIRFFVNGVLTNTVSDSYNASSSSPFTVGALDASGSYDFNGYVSNARIVKGVAVYTSAFTPPTAPLTAVAGTVLLTAQSNRFVDNSASQHVLTVTGTPIVQRLNPFGASAAQAYSTSTIGGSGYFDGGGDFLTVPNTAPLQILGGSFTLDCWIYLKAAQANMGILGTHNNSSNGYFIRLDTSIIRFYTSAATVDRTYAFAQNTWYHIAIVSSGTTGTMYINGVAQGATFSTNGTQDTVDDFIIGKTTTLTNYFSGYISDVRVIKGSAVTPPVGGPTAPLTAVTNTTLLLNYTNGAIYDNSMMPDFETAGNAQISTSVYKYGTGSLSFDGTGDYLSARNNQLYAFGTGSFTIESWIYPTATTSYRTIFTSRAGVSASAVWFGLNTGTMYPVLYTGTALLVSSIAVSLNTWTHVALVRNGGTSTIYVNGVSGGSVSDTNSYTETGCSVGYDPTGSNYFWYGYLDDLRITNGYARYTANFTPPTAALLNYGPI